MRSKNVCFSGKRFELPLFTNCLAVFSHVATLFQWSEFIVSGCLLCCCVCGWDGKVLNLNKMKEEQLTLQSDGELLPMPKPSEGSAGGEEHSQGVHSQPSKDYTRSHQKTVHPFFHPLLPGELNGNLTSMETFKSKMRLKVLKNWTTWITFQDVLICSCGSGGNDMFSKTRPHSIFFPSSSKPT